LDNQYPWSGNDDDGNTRARGADDDQGDGGVPSTLHLVDCSNMPELNGLYERTDDFLAFDSDHAVYRRRAGPSQPTSVTAAHTPTANTADGGGSNSAALNSSSPTESKPLVLFFWKFSAVRKGWWIGENFGSKNGLHAHCPTESTTPPRSGWHVNKDGRRQVSGALVALLVS
jgi:hypothetical protein